MLTRNPIDIHIGRKLREIRSTLGISQDRLGNMIGVTFQQVQKYEKGFNRVSASRLYEFAQALNRPISAFFDDYVDDGYYNFQFKNEAFYKAEEIKNRQVSKLIKSFTQIYNLEVRKNIITLVDSVVNDDN